ncbi:sugar ABC transporter ATP-binding protein [Treponema brennaborense]|uniref:Monosaccharide-transporting ATPase n=1 Tax=Treponema brennaborense (strain DSM 12168 / CIP 105900 / DD5/3) TaxID=906968 RepID=F4LLJ5_TREBD|nr:sugar ABC transporter ATP-binding protein [Treponema brennaborense]AEE16659.1 Monosaccharide-transporting ATPase [Treponema brennaborense DSM 12168]
MSPVIVEMNRISKTFPGVRALDEVDFELRSGEVMALLGENGAGKSTLMKILSGVYARDSGTVRIFGENLEHITPVVARRHGVAIIHQELQMCQHLSVAENMFLGREYCRKGGLLDEAAMRAEAARVLKSLCIDIDPDTKVGDLAVSKQQMVEIAKALSARARILIMDEPTSALTSKEIDELFSIIRTLKENGVGIVYISHRLEELQHIVDRVTVMRDGKYIMSGNWQDTTLDRIITDMVGREIKEKFPRISCTPGKTILSVTNLSAGSLVSGVNLSVREGEILGIAGLMGAGRTELTRAIFGVDGKTSGEIVLDGKPVTIRTPADAIRCGIVLAPEDRKKDGLCTKLAVRENISLPNLDLLCNPFGIVNRKKERELTERAVLNFKIKLPHAEVAAASLSGGNQQKVVVAKWLSRKSRVVFFDEPTRGIDVAAKVEIYQLMNRLKAQGIGVVFVSSELPEILGMADRIAVMCGGKISGELSGSEATQKNIMVLATKFEKKAG